MTMFILLNCFLLLDDMRIDCVRPAFVNVNNKESFANNVIGMHGSVLDLMSEFNHLPYRERIFHTCYGNDDELSIEEIKYLNNLYENYTLLFKWQIGDILIIDNTHWSHMRYPFNGKRDIAAMIGMPVIRCKTQHNGVTTLDYSPNLKSVTRLRQGSDYNYNTSLNT